MLRSACLLLCLSIPTIAADQADLDAIAKRLRAKSATEKAKACEDAGKLGGDAAPLLRDLCSAALDPAAQQAALEAISKIDAKLFPVVTTLAIDKTPKARARAITSTDLPSMLSLGKLSLPALPLIYAAGLPFPAGKSEADRVVFEAVIQYVEKMTPDDPLTVAFLAEVLKSTGQLEYHRQPALTAIRVLGDAKVLRKELAALLPAQLKSTQPTTRSLAATAAGSLGSEGKALLPVLKKLQLDSDNTVRQAAGAAVAKIEAAK